MRCCEGDYELLFIQYYFFNDYFSTPQANLQILFWPQFAFPFTTTHIHNFFNFLAAHFPRTICLIFHIFLDNFTWIYLPFNSPLFLRDGMQNNNFNFIRSVMYMCIKKEKKQRFKIILANTSFHIKSWKTTELQTNCAQIELAWMSRDM